MAARIGCGCIVVGVSAAAAAVINGAIVDGYFSSMNRCVVIINRR